LVPVHVRQATALEDAVDDGGGKVVVQHAPQSCFW